VTSIRLASLARASLAITTVTARDRPAPNGLIPLTLSEIRHLYDTLAVVPAADIPHVLRFSHWRGRRQYRATFLAAHARKVPFSRSHATKGPLTTS
jgi:hypothetical protein